VLSGAGGALAIDAGSVRVGLAAADPTGTLASPVAVLDATRPDTLWARVAAEARDRASTVIVVGLPRQMSGAEGEAAERARRLATEAAERTGLRVELYDERLSTVEAERALIAQGVRRRPRRERVDAVAATIVLQAWLDARRARARR
jgi:putative pre-16S rRNA nuclease